MILLLVREEGMVFELFVRFTNKGNCNGYITIICHLLPTTIRRVEGELAFPNTLLRR
jgi:hypothetical protein